MTSVTILSRCKSLMVLTLAFWTYSSFKAIPRVVIMSSKKWPEQFKV